MKPCVLGTLAAGVLSAATLWPTISTAADDLEPVKAVIAAANADWIAAVRAKDAHRAVEPYAENAVDVRADGVVLAGRAAIEQAQTRRFADGPTLLDGVLYDDGVVAAGDAVYEWGHSALRWKKADGAVAATSVRFLTIWRKDDAGRWRIIRNLNF